MDTFYMKKKAYGLREKAEDATKQLVERAYTVKDLLKLQYDISALKAMVIKLEVSLKKDFEKAGRAIYTQCEGADGISEEYADQVLALFAEIDAKREMIAELREDIAHLEFCANPVFEDDLPYEDYDEEPEEIPLVEKMEDAVDEVKDALEEIVEGKEN